jgi:hypothetical protein
MSTLNELKGLTALVYMILDHYPQTRNSDGLLWLKVLESQAYDKGIDLRLLSVPFFLPRIAEMGFSPFESVRRTRQKLQAAYPHLAACEAVEGFRTENEQQYRAFARSDI